MKRFARPVLAVVFLALLATPALIRRFGHRGETSGAAAADVARRYGFQLTESSKESGLAFVHEAPTLDARLAHIMPQVASMGAAVAVADGDGDGRPPFYGTNNKEGSK